MRFMRVGMKGLAMMAAASVAGGVLAQGGAAGQESSSGATDPGATSGTPSQGPSAQPSTGGGMTGAMSQMGRQHEVSGQVQSISSQALTLSTGEQVRITDQTQFMRNGQTIQRTEIKPGEQVRAAYQPRNGLAYATTVEVTGGGQQGGMQQGAGGGQSGSETPGSSGY